MTVNPQFVVPPPPPAETGETVYHEYFTQLEALVRRYRGLAAEKAALDAEMKSIQDQVRGLTQPGWKMIVDNVPASNREGNRVFSEELALQHLPVDAKKRCVDKTPRFDSKLIRKEVEAAGLLETCMVADPEKQSVVKLS